MEPSASQLSLIPSLLSTAKLAYELTSQEWSQIGGNGATSELNVLTERILAVMLIRLLAIVNFRSRNNIEHFTILVPLKTIGKLLLFRKSTLINF